MNNENRMYKLQNGTETAIWAHDEIICLREQLAQAQAEKLYTQTKTQKKILKESIQEIEAKVADLISERDQLLKQLNEVSK